MSTGREADLLAELERRRRELHGPFGNDAVGRLAEKAARFFGTPHYIVRQTVAVAAWVLLNSTQLQLGFAWDVYPFIALNLLFSFQAAYAAPLMLLAQNRQADRDECTPIESARVTAGSNGPRRSRLTRSSNCTGRTLTSPSRTRH
jgi:uncharacterized membrane protein